MIPMQNKRMRRVHPSRLLVVLAAMAVIIAMTAQSAAEKEDNTEQPVFYSSVIAMQDKHLQRPEAAPEVMTAAMPETIPEPPQTAEAEQEEEFTPDEADVEMLARLIWGEARGVRSTMEKAAVVWCVLNRVDDPRWPDTIAQVVTQKHQFMGYSRKHPATEEFKELATDVLIRWEREKAGCADVGRVIPAKYTFFAGDGRRNHFRNKYRGGKRWKWNMENPYES